MQAFLLFFVSSHIEYTPTGELSLLQIIRVRLSPSCSSKAERGIENISSANIKLTEDDHKTPGDFLDNPKAEKGIDPKLLHLFAGKDMPAGCRRRASTACLITVVA